MQDDIDRIMEVMAAAFDPAFGEAWTRSQVCDALLSPYCRYLLAGTDGQEAEDGVEAAGFAMTRQVLDEEELLLLAVKPEHRGNGIASKLIQQIQHLAPAKGVDRVFLEMRDGNPAQFLYQKHGFHEIGRRKGYYRLGTGVPIDAITFSWQCQLG